MPGRLRALVIAALLAFGLLVLCKQITLHGWYADHPAYRAQVDAMLSGRFALSSSPDGLYHDMVWTHGGTQQVWGLGVALWQLPFEVVGRAIGLTPFPDRVPLLVFMTLQMYALLRAFRPRDGESRWTQVGAILIAGFLPGVIAMLRGRLGVYEEAELYAYAAGAMLLAAIVAFAREPSARRYLVIAALGGLTGLIRPTVWFYALAALIVGGVMLASRVRAWRRVVSVIAIAAALFVAGGATLYATNAARFGRGTEFGHRLNIHSLPGNVVATRFSFPFQRAGTIEAAEELVGAMFGRPEVRYKRSSDRWRFYQSKLHVGQAVLPRWREYYFSTYSWPYVPLLLLGTLLGVLAWRRRDGDPIDRALVAWALIGMAPLFAFYMRSPSLSSRYLIDFGPGLVALLVITWRRFSARRSRLAFALLALGWGASVYTSRVLHGTAADPVGRLDAENTEWLVTSPLEFEHPLPNAYAIDDLQSARYIDDPAWQYERCADADGHPISCNAPPLDGDVVVTGVRVGNLWGMNRAEVVTTPSDDDVCRPAPQECAADTVLAAPRNAAVYGDVADPILYENGFGWESDTGAVPPATLFYLRDPAYVELEVEGPAGTDWEHAVRVAVELEHLQLVAVADTAHGARLRFAIAEAHPGLVVAFIAFGPDTELDRPVSEFKLRSIRWRDD